MSDKHPDYTCQARPAGEQVEAPQLPYRPSNPRSYRPNIGLIACGAVTTTHLQAYKAAGYSVVALCDCMRQRAEERRRDFYPEARVYTDYRDVLKRDDVQVVDIALHAPQRHPIIRAALNAGKHVLSQKPFVLDLDTGLELVELAEKKNLRLAVNQNGRFAPHFAYMRHAIAEGLIGTPMSAHIHIHWDHNWIVATAFDQVHHVILHDFAIHWFDILCCFMGQRQPRRVFATLARSPSQKAKPPLLGQALVEYDNAQASLVFDGDTRFGQEDRTFVAGNHGSIQSCGPDLSHQQVTLFTARGVARPRLEGNWFPDGFHGTMAELLCSIEENREPLNSARNNLRSLALCFAAVASAETGQPQVPGQVRRLPQ